MKAAVFLFGGVFGFLVCLGWSKFVKSDSSSLPVQVGLIPGMPNTYSLNAKAEEKVVVVLNLDSKSKPRSLSLTVMSDVYVSADCAYSTEGVPFINRLTFHSGKSTMVDYGFDGIYDLRFDDDINGKNQPSQVFFAKEWRDITVQDGKLMFDVQPYGQVEFISWKNGTIKTVPAILN